MSRHKVNRIDYSEFLLATQINYTLTYYADHKADISHDKLKRYLENDKLTPSLVYEHTSKELEPSPNGRLIFDDTVLDKKHSKKIETSQLQYSGNEKNLIRGIGVVNCIYYNPDVDKFWIIDYRIYDKSADGKSKIDHLLEMLINVTHYKQLPFSTVLMDTWYATTQVMYTISNHNKIFYCPIKTNRLVSRVDQEYWHIPVQQLEWTEYDLQQGQRVHLHKMNKNFHVQLFRITGTHRTDFIVTNDLSQNSMDDVQNEHTMRWKVEEFHREIKQTTGIESCQCRKQRIQRNHIACAMLVWNRLKNIAYQTNQTIYAIKNNLLQNYMRQQLRSPAVSMSGFA